MKTNPTGFTVNGYLNRYSSGVTGVTYVVATPQTNPLTINHIEVWGSSAQTERSRLKVMNEDNIHSYMWRSGYFIYLGTRLDIFAKPGWATAIANLPSGATLEPWPIHTGYQRTRYYVPKGLDPEATYSGASIPGKFTYSDGRKGVPKMTKWYGGKE